MAHIMLDLETLGQTPRAAFFEIGAVFFDPMTANLGETFHQIINPLTCYEYELLRNPKTLQWWEKQSDEARTNLIAAQNCEIGISQALLLFYNWLNDNCGLEQLKVWGNGSDFDNAIMANAYAQTNVNGGKTPWSFWNNRCYRTIKALAPKIKIERTGTHHNALDDAISQAKHLQSITRKLRLKF